MTNIYEKQEWIDHIVERPGTFREIQNSDGSITHVPEEGNILEEGSPFSANRMNHIEDGIYNVSRQANINKDNITSLIIEVAILKGNALNGIGHNMFIVNFVNLDSVELVHGVYDEAMKRLVI
ncbi:hypothetical protein KQI38_15605 [Tissierella carlieri]|uniref:hypothetical protein n=1 Tax=Tissierella carlieri TaxID=689904 RepID=UPI001C0F5F2F|nr:hypothetical protein [Tissierella carlieri]MBU5313447.1 hypothetical protein [Tissierella carlieri]